MRPIIPIILMLGMASPALAGLPQAVNRIHKTDRLPIAPCVAQLGALECTDMASLPGKAR